MEVITRRCYARVGLLGNPSDGYGGACIGFSLANFSARVTLTPVDGATVSVASHPEHDPPAFASLHSLAVRARREGLHGGVRLLLSACAVFHDFHASRGAALPTDRGFVLSYETDIPRQAGLSGSSALVTATVSCLEAFYSAPVLPLEQRPSLVLAAETALGIAAGLQDRVVQTYDGCVFMDFKDVASRGYGAYTRVDEALLPRLWLVWGAQPSDSGTVHAPLRKRWEAGEPAVVASMARLAAIAAEGKAALEGGDTRRLADLMRENFAVRRGLFGDAALGGDNLRMVEAATRCGGAAKFTGSGGCLVVCCPGGREQEEALRADCAAAGLRVEAVRVHGPEA